MSANNWSTGLFSIFDDLAIFIYAAAAQCLAVNNIVMIKEGKGAFNIDGAKIAGPCKGMGCTTTDGAMCISGCICQILPCVYPLWRGDLRQKYGIKGSLVGDFLALCYCCTCAIMQDSREIKVQGLGYGNLTSKTMDKA